MSAERKASDDRSGAPARGRFLWLRLVLWLPACAVLAALVAWAAVVAASYFAPFIIFPILVGVGLGALTVFIMRLGQVGNRPTVLAGTVLAVVLTVAGQHYVQYLKYLDSYHRTSGHHWTSGKVRTDRNTEQRLSQLVKSWTPSFTEFMRRQAARGRPLPGSYLARGRTAWISWAMDGLLVLLAALAMVVPATWQPYCDRCRSWYRITRSRRIDVHTAGRLADVAGLDRAEHPASARYRLLDCNGGCGPTEFELSWDESPGGTSVARAWLDAESGNRIAQVLNEAKALGSESCPLPPDP